jgi:anaerobic magnesium-protoporphyrin IX monomethyl ester cyclase
MKVLLVQPPYPLSEFPKPSSALLSLGTVLQKDGVEVQVLDLLSTGYSPKKIEACLARFQPDIIGATSVTMNFPRAAQILQVCKRHLPQATLIMGGPHVTFMARETLQRFPEIDGIVRGEGEETLREIVSCLDKKESLQRVRGWTFRSNGNIVATEDRPLIQDLNLLPLPDRRLFPLSRYLAMRVPASVLSSRGCPVGCSFCVGYQMTGRQGRFRDPLKVVDEIEGALQLGFEEICIDDDLFTRNRRHVFKICEKILSRGLKFKMYIFARVDTVDPILLRKLKEAGCGMICFGLESGNQKILAQANKQTTVEMARRAVQMSKDAGISPFGSFVLGLPGESQKTMEETLSFARGLEIPFGFHLLSPFPGTRIRERATEFGIKILSDDWSLYDADHAITETDQLKARDVQNFAHSFFRNLEAQVEKMKEETLAGTYRGPYLEEIERQLEVNFVWKLLEKDLLEELGSIPKAELSSAPAPKGSLDLLIARITQRLSMPAFFVEKKMRKLSERGLIVNQENKDFFLWEWKEN